MVVVLRAGNRDAAKHPTMDKTDPTTKNGLDQNVRSA